MSILRTVSPIHLLSIQFFFWQSMRWLKAIASLMCAVLIMLTSTAIAQKHQTAYSIEQNEKWKSFRIYAESLASQRKVPVRLENIEGRTIELQRFNGDVPLFFTTQNLTAAKSISTDKVRADGGAGFSLSGVSQVIGEWDAGSALASHQEFDSRIISTEGYPNFHSTHIAGTLIAAGVNINARGMAPSASLKSFDWNNDLGEVATEATNGLRISNHSYGTIAGWTYNLFNDGRWVWFGDTQVSTSEDYHFGFYGDEARAWDEMAHHAPYLVVCKSAGNDRGLGPTGSSSHWIFTRDGKALDETRRSLNGNESGFDCLVGSSCSKNVITVGSVEDIEEGYQSAQSVHMAAFSSWGPTDDGRIKPDLVANGANLFSAYDRSNDSYGILSGTSMASASVAGSIALLEEQENILHPDHVPLSSTIKALLIHTADETGPAPGPDYMFGWGLMNTFSTLRLQVLNKTDGSQSHISEQKIAQGESLKIRLRCDGTQPLRVTICWNDPAGLSPEKELNPRNRMLVNDIDIRIVRESDGMIFFPWVLDPALPSAPAAVGDNMTDNTEQVVIPSPASGKYTVVISHKGNLSGGSQAVSIVMSGNVMPKKKLIASLVHSEIAVGLNQGVEDSLIMRNESDSILSYHIIRSINSRFIPSIADGVIASGDSTTIRLMIEGTPSSAESSYVDTIRIETNSADQPTIYLPIIIRLASGEILMGVADGMARTHQLFQNYPNPFNPSTTIRFEVSPAKPSAEVSLRIFDVGGREVGRLIEGMMTPGLHEVHWGAAAIPSGIYLYQLQIDHYTERRKMILLR